MSNLYKDAIADARKLRETAEQNAKNRIIEAVTPQLRKLIERQIAEGGEDEFVEDIDADALLDTPDAMDMLDDIEPADVVNEPMDMAPAPMDIDTDGLASIEVIPDEEESATEYEDESQHKSVHVNITVEGKRNHLLRHRAIRLVKALSEAKTRSQRNKIRKELDILRQALIITENSQNVRLAKNITVILKESTMRRRNNRWLFEGKEEDEAGAEEVEFDDNEFDDSDGGTVEVDAAGLEDALGLPSGTITDAMGGDSDEEESDDDADEFDLDMDDKDLEESDEYGESDESLAESDELDQCETDEMGDEIVEVNEAMLRRALGASRRRRTPRKSSRRVNESRRSRIARARRRRRIVEAEAKAQAGQYGGGKLGKEMFVDVDENTLLNALAEELGSDENASDAAGKASAAAGDFGGGSIKRGVVPESRRRRAYARRSQRQLSETKRIAKKNARVARAAKAELKESNLFNAKLLFVTKLLQSHSLNNKQQRAIIEAMDNAKTQREAKLLFTSLNESLNNKVRKNRSSSRLTENRSRTGASSRSLQSGQAPRGNGVELDRWAVLAGLRK